ncbi:MAG: hypothetical protein ACI81Q_002051 [Paracoccaceae bacterium]|jgi:uncharacterized protein (DUF2147 family)
MRALLGAAALVIGVSGMTSADAIEGRWRTAADDNGNTGTINVVACDAAFCGTLVEAFDTTGATMVSENVGRQIIWDTVNQGDGTYRGRVYSPEQDREYRSSLELVGDELIVSGCVMGGAICREGGRWQREN